MCVCLSVCVSVIFVNSPLCLLYINVYLDLGLDILDGIRGLDFGKASTLDEHLHSTLKPEDKVKS